MLRARRRDGWFLLSRILDSWLRIYRFAAQCRYKFDDFERQNGRQAIDGVGDTTIFRFFAKAVTEIWTGRKSISSTVRSLK